MRRLLSLLLKAPERLWIVRSVWFAVAPLKLSHVCPPLSTWSLQGDTACNGSHSKKALLSDPQLFDAQFEELVTELTERDLTDPVLVDALKRLREVCYVLCVG